VAELPLPPAAARMMTVCGAKVQWVGMKDAPQMKIPACLRSVPAEMMLVGVISLD
jgi:2-keto-3-deoxy-galactonokinase